MKLVIIDYGLGNLLSVANGLKHLGVKAVVSPDPKDLADADAVILPGVGAFADGMKGLQEKGFVEAVGAYAASGRPLLGICLGMQLLLTRGYEFGEHEGLGLIRGEVVLLQERRNPGTPPLKIPHIGWNQIRPNSRSWPGTILEDLPDASEMYFVHSFCAVPADPAHILAETEYEDCRFCSVVARDHIYGTQFHPEKSSTGGIRILENFLKIAKS